MTWADNTLKAGCGGSIQLKLHITSCRVFTCESSRYLIWSRYAHTEAYKL